MGKKQLTENANHDKMTIDEVADDLRVHRSTVSRLIIEGELPYYNVKGRKLIKRVDLEAFFENQRVEKSKNFALCKVNNGYSHCRGANSQ